MKTMKIIAALAAVAAMQAAGASVRTSLDRGWVFSLDGAERIVDVPHDWSIESAPDKRNASSWSGGYYPGGIGIYRRTFFITKEDLGREVEIVFDGVYREAEVSVNGGSAFKGTFYGYTGFTVPLAAESLKVGANTLKVTVRNDRQPNCRWYSGSGIFRHVWLVRREKGTKVDDLAVRTDMDGTVVITGKVGGRRESKTYKVENPVLWTPDTPKLYDFDFFGERVRTGIRTVGWDKKRGFLLNGESVKLHGACVHHDHGPLGAASYDAAELRKVRQLKAAGFNAVRTSHNPVSEAFLDACDAEGLLVIDDMFDGWREPKNKGDYSEVFGERNLEDLSWIVRRDRVHPSVVMWSIGNEILERTSKQAVADSKAMAGRCRELDPTRPVTMALCTWGGESQWLAQDELAATLDIVGYNYAEEFTEKDKTRCPDRVIVYTETFPRDAAKVWRRIMSHGYVAGEFVWTGIDYLGESTIGRAYYDGTEPDGEHHEIPGTSFPWHGAYCGDIDLTGWRKPISHWRETLWNPKAPTYLAVREPDGWRGKIKETRWSVWPTWERWNFEGWEGKKIVAEVYTRRPEVKLYLNGRLVGKRDVSADTDWKAEFELSYEPGELKAVDSDGGTSVLRTAGAPADVRFTRERIGDLTYVTAEVVDANGTVCPDAAQDVEFKGDVIATCSADMKDCVPATSRTRRTWRGRAMAVVREDASPAESVVLARLFGDGAVLQREKEIPVWGWTAPNTKVCGRLAGVEVWEGVGNDGKFTLRFPPQKAGGPWELVVSNAVTGAAATSHDVMVGEVWLASGQSNMAFKMNASPQIGDFLAAKEDPSLVREFQVERNATGFVESALERSRWAYSNEEDVGEFSAVAFWFARRLQRELGVTVGIINASWGGTCIEAWTSREKMLRNPYTQPKVKAADAVRAKATRWEGSGKQLGMPSLRRDLRRFYEVSCGRDEPNDGVARGWAKDDFDDSAWETTRMPGDWTKIIGGSGVVWLRLAVDVPAEWAGKPLSLQLGGIDKTDITYFNGEEVGRTGRGFDETVWNRPRNYSVPGSLVKAGRNVIAVRNYSFIYNGGFCGLPNSYRLVSADGGEIPLAGDWKFAAEKKFGPVRVGGGPSVGLGPGNANTPSILFDGMVNPLVPAAIRGAIWYQGCSNTSTIDSCAAYEREMEDLIEDWRYRFAQGDFPFGVVQLAAFRRQSLHEEGAQYAHLRESQRRAVRDTPHAGLAVAIDVGDPSDIHPKDKRTVGERLSAWALKEAYGRADVKTGPEYLGKTVSDDTLLLRFSNGGAPLTLKPNEKGETGFFVSADGKTYFPARARVMDGDKVKVWSDKVPAPKFVDYAFAEYPLAAALFNDAGFPASPFRD